MKLLGISGRRGSGKDTAFEMLNLIAKRHAKDYPGPASESKTPDPFQNIKFAKGVKYITAELTGYQDQYTQEGKATFMPEFGMTVGDAQQKIGTGLRDTFHEQVWLMAAMRKASAGDSIITDVRFPNEVLAIHLMGGVMLRLEGDPMGQQGDGTRDDNHISETALDDYPFEYRIENNGTPAELYAKLEKFYVDILHNR